MNKHTAIVQGASGPPQKRPALYRSVSGTVKPVREQKGSNRGLFLTREEMAAIARAASTNRDQLLIRALAETGARISELLELTPSRIREGYVLLPVLKQRGIEDKSVYLSPDSRLLYRLLMLANSEGLRSGDRFWPISRQRAHQIVTAAAEAAGVYRDKPTWKDGVEAVERVPAWPHLFRHGAATAMLEDSDDDVVFVQRQLGHKRIEQTMEYAVLSEAKRREKAARIKIAPETWGRD